jgi:flagellar hook-length control protein FliK
MLALASAKAAGTGTASTATTTTTVAATTSSDAALEQQIQALLDGGTSPSDIASRLASSLAASVASALGVSTEAAKAKLTQTFTAALTPASIGPPPSNAERASALVTRLRQLAELVTRVTNEETGQPIRLIAGQSSDAETAGATPAPTSESILRDALAALAAPASPMVTAQAASTVPAGSAAVARTSTTGAAATTPRATTSITGTPNLPARTIGGPVSSGTPMKATWDGGLPISATPVIDTVGGVAETSGDGRTVAVDPATTVATGGDTPIGRILARASLANQASAVTDVSADDSASTSSASTSTGTAPMVTPATTASAAATAVTAGAMKALDAFAQAFSAALARDDAAKDAASSTASAGGASATTSLASLEAASGLVANTHDATAIAPPTPASTLPQTQTVDPNAVVDQVLQGVSLRISDGSSVVRLRLVPENLGDVSVKLVVTGGSVDASITTSTPEAQSALLGGQAQLTRTLADAGLKLQSFTVALGTGGGSTSNGNGDANADARSRQSSTQRIGAIGSTVGDETDADDPSLLALPAIGPPIYTASTALGALNYLV